MWRVNITSLRLIHTDKQRAMMDGWILHERKLQITMIHLNNNNTSTQQVLLHIDGLYIIRTDINNKKALQKYTLLEHLKILSPKSTKPRNYKNTEITKAMKICKIVNLLLYLTALHVWGDFGEEALYNEQFLRHIAHARHREHTSENSSSSSWIVATRVQPKRSRNAFRATLWEESAGAKR